jgi:2-polyprenyl-3-methyl-5-hydroxy-6-metoxy-1,4-benzoquinol methylase
VAWIERQTVTQLEDVEPLHLERYRIAARYVNGLGPVLDAACGCGYGTAVLAKNAWLVYGADRSEEAVEHAKKYWSRDNVTYLVHDLERSWSVPRDDAQLAAIVSLETLEHLNDSFGRIFRQVNEQLAVGGLFIYSHPIMEAVKRGGPHKKFQLKVDEVLAVAKLRGFDPVETVIQKNDRMPFDHAVVVVRKRG